MSFSISKKGKAFLLATSLFISLANLVNAKTNPQQADEHSTSKTPQKTPRTPSPRPQVDSAADPIPTPAEQEKTDLQEVLSDDDKTQKFLKDNEGVSKALEAIDLNSKELDLEKLKLDQLKAALEKVGIDNPTDEQLQALLSHYVSQKALAGSESHADFIQKVLDGARGKAAKDLTPLEKNLNDRGLVLREKMLADNPKLRKPLDKLSHQSLSAQGFQLQSIMTGLSKEKSSIDYKKAITRLSQWVTPLSESSRKEIAKAVGKATPESVSGVLRTAIEAQGSKSERQKLAASATSGLVDMALLKMANEGEKNRAAEFKKAVATASTYSELVKNLDDKKIAETKGLIEWAASSNSKFARRVLELKAQETSPKDGNPSLELRSNSVGGNGESPGVIKVFGGDAKDAAEAARELASAGSFSEMIEKTQKQSKDFNPTGISTASSPASLSFYGKSHVKSLQHEGAALLRNPPPGAENSTRADKTMGKKFKGYLEALKGRDGKPDLSRESLQAFFKSGDYFEGNEDPEAVAYGKRIGTLSNQQLLTLFNQFMNDKSGEFNYCPSCWAGPGNNLDKLFPSVLGASR